MDLFKSTARPRHRPLQGRELKAIAACGAVMNGIDHCFKQNQPIGWETDTRANHYTVVDFTGQTAFYGRDGGLVGFDEADLGIPAPACKISTSASLTPARIFSAVIPAGSAGSEKSTAAGSKPINRTRFIEPLRL